MTDKAESAPKESDFGTEIREALHKLSGVVGQTAMTVATIQESMQLPKSAAFAPETIQGVRQVIFNIANICLTTGNHEVIKVARELAKGLCALIGEDPGVYFKELATAPPPAPAHVPMPVPIPAAPVPPAGISVPGMGPSPYVSGPPAQPVPLQPGQASMTVVDDPSGQMGPAGGPPEGTPGYPGATIPIAPDAIFQGS